MPYNIQKLMNELKAAGINASGCNTLGVVWDSDGVKQIQDRADVAAILAAHNPIDYAQQRSDARFDAAKITAKAIPNWATWTQAELLTWWNANLSDAIVDGFSIPAGVKTMLKAQNAALLRIAQLEIALRDRVLPDLPE